MVEIEGYKIKDYNDIDEYALYRALNDTDEESQNFYEELFFRDSHKMFKTMLALEYEQNRKKEEQENIWAYGE